MATTKGIKNLHISHDTEMLELILSKFPEEMVQDIPGTVLSENIDEVYKKSLVALHQAVKLALESYKSAKEHLNKSVTKAIKLEN